MTGSFPSDSCSNGFGPLNDRVEDFQLIAEGYDPISNTSKLFILINLQKYIVLIMRVF